MKKLIVEELEKLVAEHGVEALTAASASIASKMGMKVPLEHLGVLHPKVLENTVRQLDGCISDTLEAGDRREESYQHIGELRSQARQIESDIEITESLAFMELKTEGKNIYAVLEGVNVPLVNETMRNAYRKSVSKTQREELASVQGKIAKLETDIDKATQAWETATTTGRIVGRKADLQTRLLSYLGGNE